MNDTFLVIFPIASIIVTFSTAIGLEDNELNLFGTLVYAQNASNVTTLPAPELESVEPNASDVNTTGIDNSTEYLQYEDSDIGFKMDYPSDWQVIDTDLTNNAVVAFSPPDGSDEVDVKSYPRTGSESLKTFGDSFFKKSDSFRISAYYRNGTTLLGGEPAIRTVATFIYSPNYFEALRGDQPTTQKILAMTTLLKEKKSFLQVIYYADRSNFMDYLPEVEHMIKSFQFQSAKPVIQEED